MVLISMNGFLRNSSLIISITVLFASSENRSLSSHALSQKTWAAFLLGNKETIELEYAKWVACDVNKTVISDQIIILIDYQ